LLGLFKIVVGRLPDVLTASLLGTAIFTLAIGAIAP
jgi:hypothetical protein